MAKFKDFSTNVCLETRLCEPRSTGLYMRICACTSVQTLERLRRNSRVHRISLKMHLFVYELVGGQGGPGW